MSIFVNSSLQSSRSGVRDEVDFKENSDLRHLPGKNITASCRSSRVRGIGLLCGCLAIVIAGCISQTESDVVVYSALDQEFAQPILDAYQRASKNGTRVLGKFDVESTKTVGLVNLVIAEQQRPACDVFWNNEILHTVRLQKLGLLQPRKWNVPSSHPPDMIASDGTWCGFAARARVLIVNTKRITDPSEYPRSVFDLLDPKWKDKCAIARPLFGTTATHFAVLRQLQGEDATLEQLRKIKANAKVLSGNKQVALAVSSGTISWGLTDTDDAIIEKDQGRPIEIIFPDQASDQLGTLRIPNTLAVIRNAQHPVAAEELANYLVRPETEERLAMGNSSQLPLLGKSKIPPRVLPTTPVRWMRVDFESAAEDWEQWAKRVRSDF